MTRFFEKSILEGVDPKGRVDVLVTNALQEIARPDPKLSAVYLVTKPLIDLGLCVIAGPDSEIGKRSARALRTLERLKRQAQPRQIQGRNKKRWRKNPAFKAPRKTKDGAYIPEVVNW